MATTTYVGSTRSGNESSVLLMTTELNSLAVGAGAISGQIPNDVERDLFCDFQLVVDFVTAPVADGAVDLYLVRALEGETFEDATTGATPRGPKNGYVGSWYVAATAASQRLILPMIQLPPRDFEAFIVNRTSQAFPASGNTLKGYFYNYKSQ